MAAKKAQLAPSGTNGLTPNEEKTLSNCLADLAPLLSHQMLLGGNEVAKARDLERRLRNRLVPSQPQELAAEARAFIEQFGYIVEQHRKQDRARQEEAAAIAAAQEVARATREARIEKERLRRASAAVG